VRWLDELKRMTKPEWRTEWGFKRRLESDAEVVLGEVGLGPGQRVLDYGCGSGTFALPAARIVGEKGKVYALDISSKALARVKAKAAREGLGNVETLLSGRAEIVSFLESGTVDVVLLYDVLHLIEDRESLLRELHKILKADGFLSVYPMHLERDEMMGLAGRENLFTLRDQYKGILNFVKASV